MNFDKFNLMIGLVKLEKFAYSAFNYLFISFVFNNKLSDTIQYFVRRHFFKTIERNCHNLKIYFIQRRVPSQIFRRYE